MADAKSCLQQMLNDSRVVTKPILVLVHADDAIDEDDFIDGIQLEQMAIEYKTPMRSVLRSFVFSGIVIFSFPIFE